MQAARQRGMGPEPMQPAHDSKTGAFKLHMMRNHPLTSLTHLELVWHGFHTKLSYHRCYHDTRGDSCFYPVMLMQWCGRVEAPRGRCCCG